MVEKALDAGDVAAFQLRLVDVADHQIRRAVERLMPAVQTRDVAFLLDGRADLAAELGCDGVHLEDGASYAKARGLLGAGGMIGVSCGGSRHLAIEAAEAGADYVSFGPFFKSSTKEAEALVEPEIVEWWSEMMHAPCVAVGGLTVANCRPLIEAGADFLAASAGVWKHKDGPAAAVKAFNDLLRG